LSLLQAKVTLLVLVEEVIPKIYLLKKKKGALAHNKQSIHITITAWLGIRKRNE